MKARFNTYDIVCIVTELQRLVGMRVNQIYDIDNKTYLIRLQRTEEKVVLLLESGMRFHTTRFEWPKNVAPSGFSMKLRKHLKNKRLESLVQLGTDRIIALQFGTGEAAYHVIVELYDRGNILLCDHEMTILNVLRPHVEGEEMRFAVREKYPVDRARTNTVDMDVVRSGLEEAAPNTNLRMILNPITPFGPALIEHVLEEYQLNDRRVEGRAVVEEVVDESSQPAAGKKQQNKKQKKKENNLGKKFSFEEDFSQLQLAITAAEQMMRQGKETPSSGYIVQREEKRGANAEESFFVNLEYHPFNFTQNVNRPCRQFPSFDVAVDEFYSTLEGQKIDLRAMQQEKEALKKLSNVRTDHAKRLEGLTKAQVDDREKAELITRNQTLVDNAIMAVQHALANQMSWTDIQALVKNAQSNGDPVAGKIKKLKLEVNSITMLLDDPYAHSEESEDDDEEEKDAPLKPLLIDIDLSLTAFANARRYYDQKRTAAKKEQKTIDASARALKSAEKKTQQALKDVKTISNISKARKVFWFEKFYWFISSENYLVIGGRDQQQNELIVKRYMRSTDVYVHAEIHGASSVVIRNPAGGEVPPKTLLEAGTMAISYSVAWDAKVVTSAYWVHSDQVSKTAPTGEYLGTGSFMIRGKKNFLPPCHLILGLSFLFRLEEGSIERHRGERRVRTFDEDGGEEDKMRVMVENEQLEAVNEEEEVEIDLNEEITTTTESPDAIKSEQASPENSDSEENKFPDTHIKIDHGTGKVQVTADPKLERLTSQDVGVPEENVIFLGDDKPYVIQPKAGKQKKQQQKGQKGQSKQPAVITEVTVGKTKAADNSGLKRGQRSKLKKIKEKYKDQDEDERQMRMEILKSDGKTAKEKAERAQEEEQAKIIRRMPKQPKPKEAGAEEEDEAPANADVDMLEGLTGQPHDEDELLFAIPVVAPYQTLQNYK